MIKLTSLSLSISPFLYSAYSLYSVFAALRLNHMQIFCSLLQIIFLPGLPIPGCEEGGGGTDLSAASSN